MAFTVQDYSDLVRLLAEHPEWQADLRRLLLTDDFLALPQVVQELAEAQRRTETRLEELAEAQRRTETRLEELAEAQRRTETRLERLEAAVLELAEAQRRTEQKVGELADSQRIMQTDVGSLKGARLEQQYAQRAPAYFGVWLRRVKVIWPGTLAAALEDRLESHLTPAELRDVTRLDVIVHGKPRRPEGPAEIWLAVEVSGVVDSYDVKRAHRRAALLRKAGLPAIAVAAGEAVTPGATEALRDLPVALLLDGQSDEWSADIWAEATAGLAN
jgi:hypothetical protein